MQGVVWPALLAIGAGISVLVQQVLNANLRAELGSAVWSGFISYFLGLICMVALAVALRDPLPAGGLMARVPWWAWSGGVFGAIFIGLSILLVPVLGGATYIAPSMSRAFSASRFWSAGSFSFVNNVLIRK